MNRSARLALAWVIAPLTGIPVIALIATAIGLLEYTPPSAQDWIKETGEVLAILLLYGAPVAYTVELLAGLPAYYLLKPRHWLRPAVVAGIGTVAGFVSFPVVTGLIFGDWDWAVAGALGGAAGATAGGFFWVIGLRERSGLPARTDSVPGAQ